MIVSDALVTIIVWALGVLLVALDPSDPVTSATARSKHRDGEPHGRDDH